MQPLDPSLLDPYAAPAWDRDVSGPSSSATAPSSSPHRLPLADLTALADSSSPFVSARPLQIRILVQNMWCHYAPHCSSPNKKERVTAFKEYLAGNDILLLQEMFVGHGIGRELQRELVEAAARVGLRHTAEPRVPKMGQNSGLMILSAFPLSNKDERDWGSVWEIFPTKKGILMADISFSPDAFLTVATLHLSAHSAADRAAQLAELALMIRHSRAQHAGAAQSHWQIIGGDFNICPWSQPDEHTNLIDVMATQLGFHDVFAALSGQPDGNHRTPTCTDGRRIDYVWTNIPPEYHAQWGNSFLSTADPNIPAVSDHHALQVVFKLPCRRFP
jgi:endonuclease/exonuclease/phosphatase family metal-dependent hydrolase